MNENLTAFVHQIQDLILANGWKNLFTIEVISEAEARVRIRLSPSHSFAPDEIVNEYQADVHPLEQVQQECLRALRTGRSGI